MRGHHQAFDATYARRPASSKIFFTKFFKVGFPPLVRIRSVTMPATEDGLERYEPKADRTKNLPLWDASDAAFTPGIRLCADKRAESLQNVTFCNS